MSQFMSTYQPPITANHHTCVGLALTLLQKLGDLDPQMQTSAYIVSCDELVDDINDVVSDIPDARTVQKEHVMVGCQLIINGRRGMFILDPGYHVARVVTIMADQLYPHSGWFTQSDEAHCRKDYLYSLTSDFSHVVWQVKEKRGEGAEKLSNSAVFVARPFLNPVSVTERRNLVYNFRSLLARDANGQLTAGIFFPVTLSEAAQFTIFYQSSEAKIRQKMNFSHFLSLNMLDEKEQAIVEEVNKKLNFNPGQLSELLQTLAGILIDHSFIEQMLKINDAINDLAESDDEEEKEEVKEEDIEAEQKQEMATEEKKQQYIVEPKHLDDLSYKSVHLKDILYVAAKTLMQAEYSHHLELFRSWAKQLAIS